MNTRERLLPEEVSTYEAVASEYYDSSLHPTCAAFGIASRHLIRNEIVTFDFESKFVCDVGAGRSVVAEILGNSLSELASFWMVDSSQQMLSWSEHFKQKNIERRIQSSEAIDQLRTKFDLIVASLGDPFNTEAFWKSIASSLADGGACVFTTPSYEWATIFRTSANDEYEDRALFILSDGSRHYFPSFIYSEHRQSQLIESCDLKVWKVRHASSNCLPEVPPKLVDLEPGTPIVTMYVVQRREG